MNLPRRVTVRTLSALLLGFTLTTAGALSLGVGNASALNQTQAAAVRHPCLTDGDFATKSGYEPATLTNLNSRGTRAEMYVYGGGVWCQHISSIYVGRNGGAAEFGWVRGWSNCTTNGADDVKYNEPTLFIWFELASGHINCRVHPNLTPSSGWHTFRVRGNQTNEWMPRYDGLDLYGSEITLDFSAGVSYVGMERGEEQDPGAAHWRDLHERTGGDFNPWDGHEKNNNNSGPGVYNIISNTEAKANK